MRLPSDIEFLLEDGLVQMDNHPNHHYDWRIRRELYKVINTEYQIKGFNVHGWLAVITAKHVLPIFTNIFIDDPLPEKLVNCATQVINRNLPTQSVQVLELLDEGYLGTGIDNIDWRGTVDYSAEYAGEAAYKALLEACGSHNLLESTENLLWGREVQVSPILDGNLHPSSATDYHIAHLAAYSDTASAAAVAYSTKKDCLELDKYRLHDFWEWWAKTAFVEAWNKA
jgi:hypothetical protein